MIAPSASTSFLVVMVVVALLSCPSASAQQLAEVGDHRLFPNVAETPSRALAPLVRKYLGDNSDDLTFTPVNPCRLADTRVAVGPLSPRSIRPFSATSNVLIAQAGGNAMGCGVPPEATSLALTLTVVLPDQQGNLVAFAYGSPIPLASAINFLARQIIANTTVVPISAVYGKNFTLNNNSDGTTDVVVDVVGYFSSPHAPDCVSVIQAAPAAVASIFNVAAACGIGYRIVMGGCATDASLAATDWQTVTFNSANDGWLCGGRNNTGQAVTITTTAYCCRKPGR